MMKLDQNFTMIAGNTKRIHIPIVDENNQPLNQTGNSIVFGFPNVRKVSSEGSSQGFIVTLAPNDTKDLKGTYNYEATVTDSVGNVTTVVYGEITIKERKIT
jgi:hypothetical protein